VRPLKVAICGSDVHTVYYLGAEEYPCNVGSAGHEMVGVIEAVDAPGYDLHPGQLALVLPSVDECMMAERYLSRADKVLPLPDHGSPEHYLMAQQLGTVVYAMKRIPSVLGKNVAVIGQGSAGLFFDAMCRRHGAERVIGLDLKDARVAAGLRFGATHGLNNAREEPVAAIERILDGMLADVVIEAAGDTSSINLAAHLVRVGGQLLYFGVPRANTFEFDFWTLFRKYCSITSSGASALEPGSKSFHMALGLIRDGQIDVSTMISHRLPFERLAEAYELAYSREDGAVKVIIEMPW
jgi:threonine dehydrogenase-like Zn-dependent dehydrogenase